MFVFMNIHMHKFYFWVSIRGKENKQKQELNLLEIMKDEGKAIILEKNY
jgi:hypothetical protein